MSQPHLRIVEDADASPDERYSAIIRVAVSFPKKKLVFDTEVTEPVPTAVEAMVAANEWAELAGIDPLTFVIQDDASDGSPIIVANLHWKATR